MSYWKIIILDHTHDTTYYEDNDPSYPRRPAYHVWDICLRNGFVALGYDLPPYSGDYFPAENQFKSVAVGDIVVVHIKGQMIQAIGEVTEPYSEVIDNTFALHGVMTHRIKVKWLKLFPQGEPFPPGFPTRPTFCALTDPATVTAISKLLG